MGQLAPGSCLIEYCAVESRLHAFVVTCDRVVVQRDLCGVSELEGDLRRLRFHLQSAASCPDPGGAAPLRAVQGVLKSLHQRLITPLLESVPCGTRQVTIIPHGVAHGAPFHALFDGDCYLCDRWQITQAPSAALWLALKKRPARPVGDGQSMLLMGVPDPGIAQVSREIERLADAAPGARAFCGADATLATFFAEAPEHRVLHLATHGLFRRDNPLFSGLRFADGWLLARDLYGLRLGADLVTLSACRTGVVEVAPGEELFGLVRGFVAAGARTLVASLWAADDAATASLMVPFYARLRAGCAPAAALQDAQRTLRATFPNPYHWAPFFVIGAP